MIAEVIVDVSSAQVDKIFDYNIDDTLKVLVGSRVVVPFGPRRIEGYVINLKAESILPKSKIKNIIAVLDPYSVITAEMLKLTTFMKKKYNLKTVDVLRLFLPSSIRKGLVKPIIKQMIALSNNIDLEAVLNGTRKNAHKQIELIEFFKNNKQQDRTKLNKKFGASVVNKFVDNGILTATDYEIKRSPLGSSFGTINNDVILTTEQEDAVETILKENKTYLLHGVTGSGKTEVYMRVIAHNLKQNKTAIMLVPEISLTPQVLKNFRARFGSAVALLHSGLSAGERYDEWRRIRENDAKIVIGARSAVFAPIKNVGVIIIDEEHDSSYFSETNPRYFTHDIAKFRSEYNSCPLIMGSATPSIESYSKALDNEYTLLELPNRINNKTMPEIEIIDMKTELLNGNSSMFSRRLQLELEKVIEQKNQAMVFLNRRGFSSFIRCTSCGYVAKCDDCDVSLVYHRHDNQLKCHFCNKRYSALTNCPTCGNSQIRQGAVGTQQIVSELKKVFPDVKILRMDNDTTTTKNAHSIILSEYSKTKPCILVGTQMIAKGHDFPDTTLVGIIDGDLGLHFSDYRATERTFQLITQVAGRAGREKKKGNVILQTYTPKHYVYNFARSYDYKRFFNKELNLRKVTNFPPYARIVRVLVSGEDEEKTKTFLKEFYGKLLVFKEENKKDFIYFEAMKSPIKRIKNKFRYQILMRIKLNNFDKILENIYFIHNEQKGKSVISFVEINPQNLS